MIRKYVLPIFAIALAAFAVGHALYVQRPDPDPPPPVAPPASPFGETIAGEGMVEPNNEASSTSTISIGSQVAGVVTRMAVHIGQEVKATDLLFEMDPRITEADLKVREANVPVMQAQVKVAEANLASAEDLYNRVKTLKDENAISDQEFVVDRQAYQTAQAQLALAKANVEYAKSQVEQDKTTLAVIKVRAPVDGTILQINVRVGE